MWKKEYQQYEDGTHVCIADEEGNWIADCGPEGDTECEKNADLIIEALSK